MLNSFSGIGRLGSDPEVTTTGQGLVASFKIAINEFYKEDDELKKRTHWIPCVAYDRLAEIVGEFLEKGSQVAVRGQLKTSSDKKLEVHVLELEFLSSKQPESV